MTSQNATFPTLEESFGKMNDEKITRRRRTAVEKPKVPIVRGVQQDNAELNHRLVPIDKLEAVERTLVEKIKEIDELKATVRILETKLKESEHFLAEKSVSHIPQTITKNIMTINKFENFDDKFAFKQVVKILQDAQSGMEYKSCVEVSERGCVIDAINIIRFGGYLMVAASTKTPGKFLSLSIDKKFSKIEKTWVRGKDLMERTKELLYNGHIVHITDMIDTMHARSLFDFEIEFCVF